MSSSFSKQSLLNPIHAILPSGIHHLLLSGALPPPFTQVSAASPAPRAVLGRDLIQHALPATAEAWARRRRKRSQRGVMKATEFIDIWSSGVMPFKHD
jgi:hypothetical protein